MRDNKLSRRSALRVLGAAPVVMAAFSACSKKSESLTCTDVSALSEAEKAARSALQYTDKSPKPNERCENCMHFQPPASAGQCGGCAIIKGPVHPQGYCTAWVPKAT